MESKKIMTELVKTQHKITELKKELETRVALEKNYRNSQSDSSQNIFPWGWLIPIGIIELAQVLQLKNPNITKSDHISLLSTSLVCLGAMILQMFFRIKNRSKARKESNKLQKLIDSSRSSEDICREIQTIKNKEKELCGYSGREWKLERDDDPQIEDDLIAILNWIIYTKPSCEDVFDCWPFNAFQDHFKEYSYAMDYLKTKVDGQSYSAKSENERTVIRHHKSLCAMDTSRGESSNWYITVFNIVGISICFEMNNNYAQYVAKVYNFNFNADYEGIKSSSREFLASVNTEKKKEFITLLYKACKAMGYDISKFGFTRIN